MNGMNSLLLSGQTTKVPKKTWGSDGIKPDIDINESIEWPGIDGDEWSNG